MISHDRVLARPLERWRRDTVSEYASVKAITLMAHPLSWRCRSVKPFTDLAEAGDSRPAPLVDVADLSMHRLMTADDTVLARSLGRVLASLDDPDGVISAFQSYAA
jgi:FXSXX-COOH protein